VTAIVTSAVVLAATIVGVLGFVVASLLRRRNTGSAGLDEAEGIIREAMATAAAPRAKARIVRRAA